MRLIALLTSSLGHLPRGCTPSSALRCLNQVTALGVHLQPKHAVIACHLVRVRTSGWHRPIACNPAVRACRVLMQSVRASRELDAVDPGSECQVYRYSGGNVDGIHAREVQALVERAECTARRGSHDPVWVEATHEPPGHTTIISSTEIPGRSVWAMRPEIEGIQSFETKRIHIPSCGGQGSAAISFDAGSVLAWLFSRWRPLLA